SSIAASSSSPRARSPSRSRSSRWRRSSLAASARPRIQLGPITLSSEADGSGSPAMSAAVRRASSTSFSAPARKPANLPSGCGAATAATGQQLRLSPATLALREVAKLARTLRRLLRHLHEQVDVAAEQGVARQLKAPHRAAEKECHEERDARSTGQREEHVT